MNRQEQNLLLAKLLLQHIDAANGCNVIALQTLQDIDFIRQNYTKSTVSQYIVGTKQIKEGRRTISTMPKGVAEQVRKLLNQPQPQEKTETPKQTINFGTTPQIIVKTPEQRIKEEMAKADKLKEQYTEKNGRTQETKRSARDERKSIS